MARPDQPAPLEPPGGEAPGRPQTEIDAAAQALFRLGRVFGRASIQERLAEPTQRAVELSRILVVQAVAAGPGTSGQEVTVGAVAARLAVDPSTASRLVAETIGDGYLERAPARADRRAVRLVLTDAGRALAEDAARYQRAVFERITRDWSDRERREFARLFVRFADAAAAHITATATHDHRPPR